MPRSDRRIAAVVVTYNRKAALGECVDALLRQTHPPDALYIIDNCSTDGTYDDLLGRKLIAPAVPADDEPVETVQTVAVTDLPGRSLQVHYVRMTHNSGGAGGFHEGMKRATDAGFDWLWLMDDDLLVAPDALAALVRKRQTLETSQEESFLLNSLVLVRGETDEDALAFPLQELSRRGYPRIGVYHWRLSEVRHQVEDGLYPWICPFNGTFIAASAVRQIGLPNKEFFIKGDEKDFLWRAAKKLRLYTVVDSRVYHPRPRDERFDWKQYYLIRNMLIVNRHFNFTALRNLRLIAISLVRGLRHGRRGWVIVRRAIWDGLAGRLGRREDIPA